jgi:hypothetical protein
MVAKKNNEIEMVGPEGVDLEIGDPNAELAVGAQVAGIT